MIPGSREWVHATKLMLDAMTLPQMDLMTKAGEKMHYRKSLKRYTDEEIRAEYERRGLNGKDISR